MSGSGRAVQQPQERTRGSRARRRGLWEPACGCNYGDACEDGALEHWKCIAFPPRPSLPLAAFPRQEPRFLLLLLAGKPSSCERGALQGGLPCSCGGRWAWGPQPGHPEERWQVFNLVKNATFSFFSQGKNFESWRSCNYGMALPPSVPSAVQHQQPSFPGLGDSWSQALLLFPTAALALCQLS